MYRGAAQPKRYGFVSLHFTNPLGTKGGQAFEIANRSLHFLGRPGAASELRARDVPVNSMVMFSAVVKAIRRGRRGLTRLLLSPSPRSFPL